MRYFPALMVVAGVLTAQDKLTEQDRIALIRGLSAEFATAKIPLPKAKRALEIGPDGPVNKEQWQEASDKNGPAARVGDLVQVTKLTVDDDKLVFELNGGGKSKRKWYQNIEVGMGTRTSPVSQQPTVAPAGMSLLVRVPKGEMPRDAAAAKQLLAAALDFERRSATEQFVDKLPEEQQAAVREKRAIEGMDRETVILAMGRPVRKSRETKDGLETEDWQYGNPPGKITFVTFADGKVIGIKESFAALGGSVTTAPRVP